MSASLTLEDGRTLWRSNLGFTGMLHLIAREVSASHLKLGLWLADKAERPSPFCEFDLRALSDDARHEFWQAAERAYAALLLKHGAEDNWSVTMYAAESLAHLLRMRVSILRGEPPAALNDLNVVMNFDGEMEQLDQLWG